MGQNLCTAGLNEIDKELIIAEDLKFEEFTSKNQEYFLSNKKDYINYLSLSDMIQIIFSMAAEETPQKGAKTYKDSLSEHKLPLAFKNKILKHPLVHDIANDSDSDYNLFIHFYEKCFEVAHKNYKSIIKDVTGRKPKDYINKLSLLPLAFQKTSNNYNKHKASCLFNIFSDEGILKKDNIDFKIFIYFSLVWPTNISLVTYNQIAEESEEIRKALPEDVVVSIYATYETKDAKEAVDEIVDNLFGSKTSLDYNEFEANLISKKLYFLFSQNGVRHYLENRTQQN